jgi:hypothetical protein
MPSKSRKAVRNVRNYDTEVKGRSHKLYEAVLLSFVEDHLPDQLVAVSSYLSNRDFENLIRFADSFGMQKQHTAWESYRASQFAALVKKYPFPDPTLKPKAKARAMDKFYEAERLCRRYNLKFRTELTSGSRRVSGQTHKMRAWIRRVIGDEPNLTSIYAKCAFGPGASIGVGYATNLGRKLLAEKWSVTPSALPYALAALSTDQHFFELLQPERGAFVNLDPELFKRKVRAKLDIVCYNKVVTVPKTSLVDRTIAVEPLLNGYLQKGIDVFMRLCLKKVGIDLTDQSRNQRLAYLGSLPDAADPFVTIDLSSASDTISLGVARLLLPAGWFHFLDAIRSPAYKFEDREVVRYNKFVSMGNGFCFPLETLIFASVCSLYSKPDDFAVYGDDIVCRQSVAERVLKTLWRFGFRHNADKTFLQGPFRESCGADWFAGVNVRPLTLDYELDKLSALIKFHNLTRTLNENVRDAFSGVRDWILESIPQQMRFERPYEGSVQGAFTVELDRFQSSPYATWDRDIQGWQWLELTDVGVGDTALPNGVAYQTALMMAALRGSPSSKPFALRRKTRQSIRRMSYAGACSTLSAEDVISLDWKRRILRHLPHST